MHFSQKAILPIIIINGTLQILQIPGKNCSNIVLARSLFLLFISFERDNGIGIGHHHCQSFLPQGRKFERTNNSLLFEADV